MPLNTGNMGGVGDLVKALTGRGAIRQQAEADAWRRADDIGRAKKAAAEAGIAQDELSIRQGSVLADALTGLGADPKDRHSLVVESIDVRSGVGERSDHHHGSRHAVCRRLVKPSSAGRDDAPRFWLSNHALGRSSRPGGCADYLKYSLDWTPAALPHCGRLEVPHSRRSPGRSL